MIVDKRQAPAAPDQTHGKGAIWRVPSAECPDIVEAVQRARDGDCVFVAPGRYVLAEPVVVSRSVHIIGVDEVGDAATLVLDAGTLRPLLPALRLNAPSCLVKGISIEYRHSADALPDAIAQAHSIVVASGAAVLDEVHVRSSTGGVRCAEGAYGTLSCCTIAAATAAVTAAGKVFVDRCTIVGGDVGVSVKDNASGRIESTVFRDCDAGVAVVGRGRVECERCVFDGTAVGVSLTNSGISIAMPSVIRGNEFKAIRAAAVRTDGDACTADVSKNLMHGLAAAAVAVEVRGGTPEFRSNVMQGGAGTLVVCSGGAALIEANVIEDAEVGVVVRQARPTIRLNDIAKMRRVGLLVESAQRPGDDAQVVHPGDEADPHVEANHVHQCRSNILVRSVTGTFLKNDLAPTQIDNTVIDGPQSVAVVFSGNTVSGSAEGSCVLVTNGAEARVQDNELRDGKIAGVTLRRSGYTEVRGNTVSGSQAGLIATDRSIGKVLGNDCGDLPMEVFTDSQATVLLQ